jgi:uncharacterized protein YprB with RNaseH-like and TPR domain
MACHSHLNEYRIIFLDFETTGLLNNNNPPAIIQLGYYYFKIIIINNQF